VGGLRELPVILDSALVSLPTELQGTLGQIPLDEASIFKALMIFRILIIKITSINIILKSNNK